MSPFQNQWVVSWENWKFQWVIDHSIPFSSMEWDCYDGSGLGRFVCVGVGVGVVHIMALERASNLFRFDRFLRNFRQRIRVLWCHDHSNSDMD